MKDPIERQAAIDAISRCMDIYINNLQTMIYKADAYKALNEVPSAQQGRKNGHWIEIEDEIITGKCSVCGWDAIFAETDVVGMPYCPNCGADMRGEEG